MTTSIQLRNARLPAKPELVLRAQLLLTSRRVRRTHCSPHYRYRIHSKEANRTLINRILRSRLQNSNITTLVQFQRINGRVRAIVISRSVSALAENNKRITDLAQQVSDVSAARDEATMRAQQAQDAAAQSKLQADRALQSQKQAQAALAAAQDDRDSASAAEKAALTKYIAAQQELRSLRAQLAKCGRSIR